MSIISFQDFEAHRALLQSKKTKAEIESRPTLSELSKKNVAACNELVDEVSKLTTLLTKIDADLARVHEYASARSQAFKNQLANVLNACEEIENASPDQLEVIIAKAKQNLS